MRSTTGPKGLSHARGGRLMVIESATVRRVWRWQWLLIVPFVGTLWVPFYNAIEPRMGGIPYFYWYQFLWVGISAALTAMVYFATRGDR